MNVFTVDVSRAARRSNVPILSKVIQSDSDHTEVWRHYSGLYPDFVVTVKTIVPDVVEIPVESTRRLQTKYGWLDLVAEEKVLAKEFLVAKKGFEEVRRTLSNAICARLRTTPFLDRVAITEGELNVSGDGERANLGNVQFGVKF